MNKYTRKSQEPESQQEDVQDELLTIHEVAKRLKVDDTTVRRWITNGSLEAIILPHMGKRQGYRVRQSTLNTLLATPATPRIVETTENNGR